MTTRIASSLAVVFLIGASVPPSVVVRLNTSDPANMIEARAQFDAGEIRLSGEVAMTLSVEGPGPLSVTLPKPLLTKAAVWRVREDGLPLREVLPGGRERWSHLYHLSPLVPGEPKVSLGALSVRAGGGSDLSIVWDEDKMPAVRVTTSVENPSVDSLRPPTDIEQIPPDPLVQPGSGGWLYVVVPVLLVGSGVLLILARRRRTPTTPRDAAWAVGELATRDLTADQCAVVLRKYLSFRFGVPAEFLTTPELAAALTCEGQLAVDSVADWRALLDECDMARFSGTAASVAGLADRARALVADAENRLTTETRRDRGNQKHI
jgi:hypothetical protein